MFIACELRIRKESLEQDNLEEYHQCLIVVCSPVLLALFGLFLFRYSCNKRVSLRFDIRNFLYWQDKKQTSKQTNKKQNKNKFPYDNFSRQE